MGFLEAETDRGRARPRLLETGQKDRMFRMNEGPKDRQRQKRQAET